MKLTDISATTKAAFLKKTTATEGIIYTFEDGGKTFRYVYDKADQKTADNGDTVRVTAKGLRFRKLKEIEMEAIPVITPPAVVYKNEVQSYTAKCGEGFTGSNTVTISAGLFESRESVAAANTLALNEAKRLAEAGLKCEPVKQPPVDNPPKVGKGKRIAGFSTFTTTGSIKAGSDILDLSEPIVELNDTVAVFIGGEAEKGRRGSVGVGGQYPNNVYRNMAEMRADKSKAHNTWAAVLGEQGLLRYDAPSRSFVDLTYLQPLFDTVVPLSLTDAVALEFVGGDKKRVRLSKKAAVDTVNAKVVIDSTKIMINYAKNRRDKTFDAKTVGFGEGDTLYFQRVKWEGMQWSEILNDWFYAKDIVVDGNGATAGSIPGAFPCHFSVEYGNGGSFKLTNWQLEQNGTYEGMGFPNSAGFGVPQTTEDWSNPWLFCPAFGGWIKDAVAENVVVKNPLAYGFHSGTHNKCGVYNTADGIKTYNGFWFLIFDSSSQIKDCWAESQYLIRVMEIEGGDGGSVKGFRTKNGIIASNSSWNATFEDLSFTFTEGAAEGNPAVLNNPMFEIHAHIKGSAGNIRVKGVKVKYEGYLDKQGGLLRDFSTKAGVDGLIIEDVQIDKLPVLQEYGRGNGYAATYAGGADNLTLKNLRTNGKMGKGFAKDNGAGYGHDNCPIDITGKKAVLDGVIAETAIVPKDAVVKENCKFDFPVKLQKD